MGCAASVPVIPERAPPHVTPKRKQRIPQSLKRAVWAKWIGEEKGTSKCLCCATHVISQMQFHCGHVKAEAHGGMACVQNLRPICASCNLSMRTMHMREFQSRYFPAAKPIE